MIEIKSNREIEFMREAGRVAALAHKAIEESIKPGITTYVLDKIAENVIRANNGIPAQKNYPARLKRMPNFPASICTSINDEVIHGIPSKKIYLKEGDIFSVDLVVYKDGFHADCARTYTVGNISAEAKKLIDITKQAFYEGIKFAKKDNRLGDICHAIGSFVEKNGYSVVKEFQGHGIGRNMHEDPGIPNYGVAGKGPRLESGMTLAIEPMIIAGNNSNVIELDDGWTIVSQSGSLSAHYENTILITEKEPEILTTI